jgi:hypothetical protein
MTSSAGWRRWMNGRGLGRKWSGLIDVTARHVPAGSEGNHETSESEQNEKATQFRTECLLIKCRAL